MRSYLNINKLEDCLLFDCIRRGYLDVIQNTATSTVNGNKLHLVVGFNMSEQAGLQDFCENLICYLIIIIVVMIRPYRLFYYHAKVEIILVSIYNIIPQENGERFLVIKSGNLLKSTQIFGNWRYRWNVSKNRNTYMCIFLVAYV